MPLDHEMRLMLINTLRKVRAFKILVSCAAQRCRVYQDLESDDDARICLALDNLVASPTEDVIPAVQSRLHDLLSHDVYVFLIFIPYFLPLDHCFFRSYVRRRALFAFRSLSKFNGDLIPRIHDKIILRLEDPDDSVVQAALVIAGELHNVSPTGSS